MITNVFISLYFAGDTSQRNEAKLFPSGERKLLSCLHVADLLINKCYWLFLHNILISVIYITTTTFVGRLIFIHSFSIY